MFFVGFALFNKAFKLNLVRWCQQHRRGSHPARRALLSCSSTAGPLAHSASARWGGGLQVTRGAGQGQLLCCSAAAMGWRPCRAALSGQGRLGQSLVLVLPHALTSTELPQCSVPACPSAAGHWCQLTVPKSGSPLISCCGLWGSCIPHVTQPFTELTHGRALEQSSSVLGFAKTRTCLGGVSEQLCTARLFLRERVQDGPRVLQPAAPCREWG